MDESSAGSSSVWKHFEKNNGAGSVSWKLYQKTLKWNESTASSLWNHIKGQPPLCLQKSNCACNMVHIKVACTYFPFRLWLAKTWWLYDFFHARIIREYSTIRATGRELFDSHELSICFTPMCHNENSARRMASTTNDSGDTSRR